jgi:branched-chain amino acid transport system permease protein
LILTPTSVFSVGMMTEILAITLIGGMGTFLGPAVVAFILTIGLEYLRFLGEYRFITYGLLLVIVIMFMPNGLGRKLFRDGELSD